MSDAKNQFLVGDYITNFENIYQILEQKEQKDFSGKTLSYFVYKPVEDNHQSATNQTPVDNISRSGFRHLITPEIVKIIYKEAGEKVDPASILDFKLIKETLYQNNPSKNIVILKQLFVERKRLPEKFTRTNKDILESILKHTSLEIGFVTKKPADDVQKEIIALVEKAIS